MRRVVILGGGAAGYAAARTLIPALERRTDVALSLVSERTHHVVRSLLFEVTSGVVAPQWALADLSRLADFGPIEVHAERVVGIAPDAGVVETEQEARRFDYLLIALGEEAALPKGWCGHPLVQVFRDDHDATRLRERLERARAEHPDGRPRVVIVGGGPAGVGLAATLASDGVLPRGAGTGERLACRVVVVEREARLLGDFPDEFGDYAARALDELGVEVLLETEALAPESSGVTGSKGSVGADVIVWTGGRRPVPVVRELGLARCGGEELDIDRFFRLTERPNVFVAGANAGSARRALRAPDLAFAVKSGRVAAKNLLAAMSGRAPVELVDPANLVVVAVGRGRAIAMGFGWIVRGRPAWALYRLAQARVLPRTVNHPGLLGTWVKEVLGGWSETG